MFNLQIGCSYDIFGEESCYITCVHEFLLHKLSSCCCFRDDRFSLKLPTHVLKRTEHASGLAHGIHSGEAARGFFFFSFLCCLLVHLRHPQLEVA